MRQSLWMVELAALVLVTGAALFRGRPAERWMALAWVADALVSPLVESQTAYQGINMPILLVDAVLALAFLVLTLRYAHAWMVLAAGSAVFQLIIHGGMMMRGDIPIHAYYVGLEVAGDLVIAALAIGVMAALRARRVTRVSEPSPLPR